MSLLLFPLPQRGERARVREDEVRKLPANALQKTTLTPAISLRERGRT